MKRFWLVLLSLGLIMVLSTSAFAVDVKFSGSYYAGGMYLDKTTLKEDAGPSTAFYFQRLRVMTDFIVSPGLKLTTRFDAMERAWGAARSAVGTTADTQSAGTRAENENIAFDYLYVTYESPIGQFKAGYMANATWGTVFGNSEAPIGKIVYSLNVTKNLLFSATLAKATENSQMANTVGYADADKNYVYLAANYKWETGRTGVLLVTGRDATTRPTAKGAFTSNEPVKLTPYIVAKFGPVALQAEVTYFSGDKEYENGNPDVDVTAWAGFVDATATFNPVYFGATFAYVSGDDKSTTDKEEGGKLNGGNDWNPCLILWNYDRGYWAGSLNGYGTTADANGMSMTNAFFYQGRVGVKPIDKLDIMASVSYAYADEKPAGYESDKYGWEVDLVGTYKITNNLSYMLGFGYLFTGDYYKGATNGNVQDDFTVINKLTLTF